MSHPRYTPRSRLYGGMMEEAYGANLDYIISTQKSDAGRGLPGRGRAQSHGLEVAEKEWRGVVAVENLQTLESFRRIAP
ncbi:MAG: hypothetical protein JO211_16385 [Acidobacteriaceae bacterium]|nr:hypothetical protein [Acidobacteriaceae bacterium]